MESKLLEDFKNINLNDDDIYYYNNTYFGRGLINLKDINILKYDLYNNDNLIPCDKIEFNDNEVKISFSDSSTHNNLIAWDFYNELSSKFGNNSNFPVVKFGTYQYRVKKLNNLIIYEKLLNFRVNHYIQAYHVLFVKINNIVVDYHKIPGYDKWYQIHNVITNVANEEEIKNYNRAIISIYKEMTQTLNIQNPNITQHIEGTHYFGSGL